MKLFGSKNKQDTPVNDAEDINLDDVSLDDEAGGDDGAIVPTGGPVAGVAKKKGSFGALAVLGLLVVIAGGGIMVVTGGDVSAVTGLLAPKDEVAAIPPPAPAEAVVADAAATVDPLAPAAVTDPSASAAVVDPLAPATVTDPSASAAVVDPLAPTAVTDPLAPAATVDPLSPAATGGFAVPVENAAASGTAPAPAPVDAGMPPVAPDTTAGAVTASEKPVTEMPGDVLPPVPAPAAAADTTAPVITPQPADAVETVATPVPPEHAMAPAQEVKADEEAINEGPAAPQEVLGIDAGPTPPPPAVTETVKDNAKEVKAAKVAEPTAAEKALLDNAAVLDQLSQTPQAVLDNPAVAGKIPAAAPPQAALVAPSFQIPAENAQIRDLPNEYFLLHSDKKESQADTRLKAANRALADGNASAAVEMYDRLRAENPRNEKVLMGRAIALQRLGQNTAAVDAYEDVLKKNPKNLDALTNMLGLLRKQSPDLALDKLKELHTTYPFNVGILAQLGTTYGDMGRYEDGHKLLDQAIAMAPGNALYMFNKAVLYDRMGDAPHAAQMYRYCLDLYYQDNSRQALPVDAIKKRLAVLQ